ncbi:hypothetical protein KP509_03G085800 [Ceratopteris richardii]|uniref:Uncharacterized protein n=1 Tax=Ceratopteris richardii TaxID=49495 RepID=A0A8T2V591_CERRI|nr:hypothetical protein KP509_03G085800 [Ceratopteris richardii]
MASWRTHTFVIIGTLAGGMYGFYVAHYAELAYKEKVKEELAKRERERVLNQMSTQQQDTEEKFF